ncbi:MAG: sigma-70 family RNA polymerase sigma factor [Planctomycetales bacterium]|nr:sigma-70 family RNA polymerase sigma factor [Planctomycetales bacterium]
MSTTMPTAEQQLTVADETVADEELLRQFVEQGDRRSLETLIRRYQHELYNYLRHYLADDNLAEDVFQLTFVNVYCKAGQFDLTRRFRPWLYSVATHQAIDFKRREKRRTHQSLDITSDPAGARGSSAAAALPDYRQPPEDPLVEGELRDGLRAAIEQVGEPGRSALELIYLQGLPYREAAVALNVPVGTVKSRVHAAVRKLSTIWQRTTDS